MEFKNGCIYPTIEELEAMGYEVTSEDELAPYIAPIGDLDIVQSSLSALMAKKQEAIEVLRAKKDLASNPVRVFELRTHATVVSNALDDIASIGMCGTDRRKQGIVPWI